MKRNSIRVPLLGGLGAVWLFWLAAGQMPVVAQERQRPAARVSAAPPSPVERRGTDQAEMVFVPAGTFTLGSTREEVDRVIEECKRAGDLESRCQAWYEGELPASTVRLEAFYLDRYEVTTALFEQFVTTTRRRTTAEEQGSGFVPIEKDGKWQLVDVMGAAWRTPSGPGSRAHADHPVVQVSWHDALAYCTWAGKRLPTEAEWEYAARGTEGRRYPWGDAWDAARVNGNMTVKTTMPVGSYPGGVSPLGIHDLAGNVWEWTSSLYRPYPYAANDGREDLTAGGDRVRRGGSWGDLPRGLRSACRGRYGPAVRFNALGLRCAQDAKQ